MVEYDVVSYNSPAALWVGLNAMARRGWSPEFITPNHPTHGFFVYVTYKRKSRR